MKAVTWRQRWSTVFAGRIIYVMIVFPVSCAAYLPLEHSLGGETLSWQSSVLAKPLPSGSTHGELDGEIAVTGNQSLMAGVGDAWSQTNR